MASRFTHRFSLGVYSEPSRIGLEYVEVRWRSLSSSLFLYGTTRSTPGTGVDRWQERGSRLLSDLVKPH